MTTAIIGTGGIGSVIARELASGGEALRLSRADNESAQTLAAGIGRAAVAADDNRDALQGADAVVLALRFTVLKGVIHRTESPIGHNRGGAAVEDPRVTAARGSRARSSSRCC